MQTNQYCTAPALLKPSASAAVPSITWLNMSGDVTITWDEVNREAILALVKQKMAAGYSFFVVTPRIFSIFGNKSVKLTDPRQLDKAVGVVVPDDQVSSIVANLGDVDVEQVVNSGAAALVQSKKVSHEAQRRASSASEVLMHQTVAIRPIVGG